MELERYYYRARYYDQNLGAFESRDRALPDRVEGNYIYVGGRPISHVDPSGWQAIGAGMAPRVAILLALGNAAADLLDAEGGPGSGPSHGEGIGGQFAGMLGDGSVTVTFSSGSSSNVRIGRGWYKARIVLSVHVMGNRCHLLQLILHELQHVNGIPGVLPPPHDPVGWEGATEAAARIQLRNMFPECVGAEGDHYGWDDAASSDEVTPLLEYYPFELAVGMVIDHRRAPDRTPYPQYPDGPRVGPNGPRPGVRLPWRFVSSGRRRMLSLSESGHGSNVAPLSVDWQWALIGTRPPVAVAVGESGWKPKP
jgi:hypothetical protein